MLPEKCSVEPSSSVGITVTSKGDAASMLPPEENKIIGTPMYWAPEQTFARNTITAALDIWAVGVLMFHLSSGILPFSSHNGKLSLIADGIRSKPARDLAAMTDGRVSPRFCLLCHRLLSKDPKIRPQTADDVLVNLMGIRSLTHCSSTFWASHHSS